MRIPAFCLALLMMLPVSVPAAAQSLMTSYVAVIGNQDLYNSNGTRLSSVWQVIRQDRANLHRFGIWQAGDQSDPYFADANNRARLEQLVMGASLPTHIVQRVMSGTARVRVDVYGNGAVFTGVAVTVLN